MNWRAPLAFVLLVALTGCAMWKESKTHTWSNATSGEQLERLFWNELKAKNWNELEKHISSGYVILNPRGTFDRTHELDELKRLEITDFTLGDFVTQQNGPDLVVTYTIVLHGTREGEPLPSAPMHMMTVWQQIPHGWVAIAHSRVPQTGPPVSSNTA